MAKKTKFHYIFDDEVTAGGTAVETFPIIPSGIMLTLKMFGGADLAIGDGIDSWAALQWGSGATWETVRVGTKMWNLHMKHDFLGDGTKRFRLVRKNESTTDKKIVVWIESLLHDV